MSGLILTFSGNALLVTFPVVVFAVTYVFRLDELPTKIGEDSRRPRVECGTDEDGEPIFSDLSGSVVSERPPRKQREVDHSVRSTAPRD
jgi:hypothetical protein